MDQRSNTIKLAPDIRGGRVLFPTAIFLGSFLLFQVQPMIGRFVLPWFGGGAGVWAATLMFFQLFLLLGYGYSHAVASGLSPHRQRVVHIGVLLLALLVLPIIPSESFRPSAGGDPTWQLLLLLAATVGVPYFALAASSPLLQHWYASLHPGRSPYRLYALSNVASLLALLTYPLLFERAWALAVQAWVWSATYVAFAVLCGIIAWHQARSNRINKPDQLQDLRSEKRPRIRRVALWILLPALASAMLLATTNRLTQEIAPVPLLWVLPLAIYLITFVLTFDSARWYRPRILLPALVTSLVGTTVFLGMNIGQPNILIDSSLLVTNLFLIGMLCHGELVALKPQSRFLTMFYLSIAAGGALGGILVALVAPSVLTTYAEFELGMGLVGLVVVVTLGREYARRSGFRRVFVLLMSAVALGISGLSVGILLFPYGGSGGSETLATMRNFYGTLRVSESRTGDSSNRIRSLAHGRTVHGMQFTDPDKRAWHTTYYAQSSGAGITLQRHPARLRGESLRIGIVGLGTGTLASYAQPGDLIRMYEINPQIVDAAREYFTYLKDAERRGATVQTVLGDARLVLEDELSAGSKEYAVLIIDAFSSDAIPVHLLTAEAFDLYRKHLAPEGIIAIHISNNYLDLTPVVRALANNNGLTPLFVKGEPDKDVGVLGSKWVIITANSEFLADPEVVAAVAPWPADSRTPFLWTDSYSSLLPLLKSHR